MISVELCDIRLQASHGVYDGEDKVGNTYQVNLVVSYDEVDKEFDSIESTVDYENLYQIVQQRMQINTPLLEKLCEGIIRRIKHQYPFISEVRLSIHKIQAAIENLEGRVGVTMIKRFDD